jgi:hypothetical protein
MAPPYASAEAIGSSFTMSGSPASTAPERSRSRIAQRERSDQASDRLTGIGGGVTHVHRSQMGLVTRDHKFANLGVIQHPLLRHRYVLAEWRRGRVGVPPSCSRWRLQQHRQAVPGPDQPRDRPLPRLPLQRQPAGAGRAPAVGLHPLDHRLERGKPSVAVRQRGLPLIR